MASEREPRSAIWPDASITLKAFEWPPGSPDLNPIEWV